MTDETIIIEYRMRPGPGEWVSFGDLMAQLATWAVIPSAGPPAVTVSKRVTVKGPSDEDALTVLTGASAESLRRVGALPTDADTVVAYRNGADGVLLCREHGGIGVGLTPLTSEDLPDGGLCTWTIPYRGGETCGRDVLAAPEPGPRDHLLCVDPRCPAGHVHSGPCPGPHKVDRVVCGDISPYSSKITCARSVSHGWPHRDRKEKGTETRRWWMSRPVD